MSETSLGILASAAVLAACGGNHHSPPAPPPASAPAVRGTGASAPSARGLAAEQILTSTSAEPPPSTRTRPRTRTRSRSSAPSIAGSSTSTRTSRSSRARQDLHDDLGRRQDPDLQPEGRPKYSNGDPIVAADFVYSMKRTLDPRPRLRTLRPGEIAGAAILARPWLRRRGGPDGRRRYRAALEKLGVTAPDDKTFVVTLDNPATYFTSAHDPVDRRSRSRRSGSHRERDRGGELRRLRPVHARYLGPQLPRSSSSRTRTGTATSSRP